LITEHIELIKKLYSYDGADYEAELYAENGFGSTLSPFMGSALFKLFNYGREYDFSKVVINPVFMNLFIHIEQVYKFYEFLIELRNSPNSISVNSEKKITIAAYGIMHVYIKKFEDNGQGVTENNKVELASKYGFTSPTSGKQLKDEFDKFNNDAEASPKQHLSRLESILQLLKTEYPKAFMAANTDYVKLQKVVKSI